MVLKQDTTASSGYHRFENDVKMYGTQTLLCSHGMTA